MIDWTTFWRDCQERPVLYPVLSLYNNFLNIKRYEHMPFYFYPQGQKVVSFEDGVIKFLDHLVDAHELERNKSDTQKSFYQRSNYVARNFHRYSNETMANLMFDTQLRKTDYDRMNSVIDNKTALFYGAATATHFTLLAYASFMLRFRTLSKVQAVVAGTAYYFAFGNVNNILYKLIVDRAVMNEARALGQEKHIQPNGSFRTRGLNF